MAHTCPVCGFAELTQPPYDSTGCASFEICPSCGTEFGYHDANKSHEELRRRWLAAGTRKPFFEAGQTRAEALRRMSPHLVADVYLYPTADGGKQLTVQPGWGCPCACSKSSDTVFYDAWPLLEAPFAPGERRRLGFVFLSGESLSGEDSAAILRRAGTFYLWEGRFIGEATVVA